MRDAAKGKQGRGVPGQVLRGLVVKVLQRRVGLVDGGAQRRCSILGRVVRRAVVALVKAKEGLFARVVNSICKSPERSWSVCDPCRARPASGGGGTDMISPPQVPPSPASASTLRNTQDAQSAHAVSEARCRSVVLAFVEPAPALDLVALHRGVLDAAVPLRVRRRALRLQSGADHVSARKDYKTCQRLWQGTFQQTASGSGRVLTEGRRSSRRARH